MKQGGAHSAGFTILETMIVLVVSATLALSAIILLNGRQNKVEFQTSVNNLGQQIQQVINETASGYYPNNTNFDCTAAAGSVPIVHTHAGTGQGTNSGCIFVGKALRFGNAGGPTLKTTQFTIYPLMTNRLDGSGQEVSAYGSGLNFANVVPIAQGASVVPINSFPSNSSLGTVVTDSTENGLSFVCAWYDGAPSCGASNANKIAVAGILASLGSYTGTALNSGSEQFNLYRLIAPAASPQNDKTVADAVVSYSPPTLLHSIGLCFASGTTNQHELITIGDSANGGLGVSLKISSNPDCS